MRAANPTDDFNDIDRPRTGTKTLIDQSPQIVTRDTKKNTVDDRFWLQ